MGELDVRAEATEYVDRIIESQRRNGYSPSVTPEQYEVAVEEATRVFDGLNRAAARMTERPREDS